MMKRLSIASVFLSLLGGLTCGSALAQQTKRPNVIVFLIDDMGYADLSCYGNQETTTPNIDRIAAEGIRFTQYYSNAPICSPSRCAIMTGQYPGRWNITSFLEARQVNKRRGLVNWLDLKATTLSSVLKNAGYATGHFGKWHLGGGRDVGDAPPVTDYGFDKVITSFEGIGDRYLPLNDAFDGKPAVKYGLGLLSEKLGRGKIEWIDRSHITGAWTDGAIEFIKKAKNEHKPFYVNLWPEDVHSPFFPPKALRGDEAKRTLYNGVTHAMDEQVSRLFDLVRNDPELRDNTLIIIASDNGPEPGAGSAGPFRGHKGNLYEGGVREPLIVWGPKLMAGSAVSTTDEQSIVSGMDLMPSILAIAGVKAAGEYSPDGEDRSMVLLGESKTARQRPVFWLRPPDRPGPAENRWPDLSMRDGEWKFLCMFDGSSPQLYNLSKDLKEAVNLADKEPQRVESMRKVLLGWYATMPKPKEPPATSRADDNGG